jgi:hypothetical protein
MADIEYAMAILVANDGNLCETENHFASIEI